MPDARNVLIEIGELPARTRALTTEEMRGVFGGGCSPSADACVFNSDCCSNKCIPLYSEIGACD